jgi:ADP-ribose pyrophosphatase
MAVDKPVGIETTGTRLVYENRWMRVREDTVRRRDGTSGIYGVVGEPDFVVIVPVDHDGRLHLVQQFRYPVRDRYWELPQGSWEHAPQADPLEVAQANCGRRLVSTPPTMTYIGHLFEACGYANQGYHIFLATGLRRGDADREHEEQVLVTRDFALSEVERMIRDGEIKDATTVAAPGLLRLKGLL